VGRAPAGERWCPTPDARDELRTFIESSPAYAIASGAPILAISLTHELVG